MKPEPQDYGRQELEYLRRNLRSLMIGDLSPADPQANLVMDAVALQVARLRQRFDAGWASTRQAIDAAFFPFPWGIIPSFQLLQFTPDDNAIAGEAVPSGSVVRASGGPAADDDRARLRTVEPVVVYPIRLARVACSEEGASLDLEITASDPSVRFGGLGGFDAVRIYLAGPFDLTFPLHEALTTGRASVASSDEGGSLALRVAAGGFADVDHIIPAMPRMLPGERLLSEFMLYPARFLCVDLTGLESACDPNGRSIRISFSFARRVSGLKGRVSNSAFVVNGVPAIDLHRASTAVTFNPHQADGRINPDPRHPGRLEVVAVREVKMSGRSIPALFDVRHGGFDCGCCWRAVREASTTEESRTVVSLGLVERRPGGRPSDECTLNARVEYCGGDFAALTRPAGWKLVEGALTANAAGGMTPPLRRVNGNCPAQEQSSPACPPLMLRGLGLVPPAAGGELMRGFLAARALMDWESSSALKGLGQERDRLVTGMIRGVRQVSIHAATSATEGRAVVLTVDPADFPGGSTQLFGRAIAMLLGEMAPPLVTTAVRLEGMDGALLSMYDPAEGRP